MNVSVLRLHQISELTVTILFGVFALLFVLAQHPAALLPWIALTLGGVVYYSAAPTEPRNRVIRVAIDPWSWFHYLVGAGVGVAGVLVLKGGEILIGMLTIALAFTIAGIDSRERH